MKLNNILKIFKYKGSLGIVLITLILTICSNDLINSISMNLLPEKEISIGMGSSNSDTQITIISEGNEYELFTNLVEENENQNAGWLYSEGIDGKTWNSLTISEGDGKVVIVTKPLSRYYFSVIGNNGGQIKIETEKGTIYKDTYLAEGEEVVRVFPFENDKSFLIIKGLLYLLEGAILYVLITIVSYYFRNSQFDGIIFTYLKKRISIVDYILCCLFLLSVSIYIYKIVGIPNYLLIGDECAYWNQPLLNNGKWDVAMLAGRFTARGYWCYIPQTIAQTIGDVTSIDSSIAWLLLVSALISWLIVYIFPGIFCELNGNTPKKIHIIPMLFIFLTIWREYLTCVLMDVFALSFFFGAIYNLLKFCNSKKDIYAIWAGVCASITCSYRASYLIGIVTIVAYEFVNILLAEKGAKENGFKVIFKGGAVMAFAFVIICLPQIQINMYRNHIGLLPYDYDEAWYGRSITCWSSDWAMTNGNQSYPILATDDQMLTMKQKVYSNDVPLNTTQLMDVYMESPMESFMLIIKKVIIGFDKKTNIAYPLPGNAVPWRSSAYMFFSLLNYFLLFAGLYALFISNTVKKKEKIYCMIIFLFVVLPETFMKMEWRYVIAGYFALYYFVDFHFITDFILLKERRCEVMGNSKFFLWFAMFALSYFLLSFIFWA